jgi:hypothetical protein
VTELVHHLLTRGITAGQLIAQLAEMDPDNILSAPDKGITLSWLVVAALDRPAEPEPQDSADSDEEDLTAAVRRLSGPGPVPGRPTLAPLLRAEGFTHSTTDLADAIRTVRAERGQPADR